MPAPDPPAAAGIGHVHLHVRDLERALAFYRDMLGFKVMQYYGESAVFLSSDGVYHHHIALNTWKGVDARPPGPKTTGLYHFAIRYPDRAAFAGAVKHLVESGYPLSGAADHGVSEAVYLNDPDGNGIELQFDRAMAEWPRDADGQLQMVTEALDLRSLIEAV